VFDPTSVDFISTPKIVRSIRSLGSIRKQIENDPASAYLEQVFTRVVDARNSLKQFTQGDQSKSARLQADGFGSYFNYWDSSDVEILDFYGDLYDVANDKLYQNHVISVIDRSFIMRMEPYPSWLGHPPIYHAG